MPLASSRPRPLMRADLWRRSRHDRLADHLLRAVAGRQARLRTRGQWHAACPGRPGRSSPAPDGACSAPRTASSTISLHPLGIARLVLPHALQRLLDDAGAAGLRPAASAGRIVSRPAAAATGYGLSTTTAWHLSLAAPRVTGRLNGRTCGAVAAVRRLAALTPESLHPAFARHWNRPMTFHPSVCPHDCPSVCALEVERLPDGRLGKVRGSRAQRVHRRRDLRQGGPLP